MMSYNLKGKIALVTGAAKGLGWAMAENLAKQGATVVLHYQTSHRLAQNNLKKLKNISPGSFTVRGDLTDEATVKKIFQRLKSLDILINNVGDFFYDEPLKNDFKQFKKVIAGNLESVFLTGKYAVPKMKNKKYARIINFACVGADRLTVRRYTTPYYIAKTGVLMLTEWLAQAVAQSGLTINCISPGVLSSSKYRPKNLLKRQIIQFKEINQAVDFLLDPKTQSVNGANLNVSRGWLPNDC